ncbi:Uncharacterized protein FKW44_003786 [Caligus rogercresseyi]|uniref:Uncharacterized protein n=1 Tax=Caligus rogercresseyi TaxID=217165 RepID=A0A7T8QXB0_CALRO|nr:Uncharacterized protein FKW44_003786 [Caligus rogercresseyi]
MIPAKPAPTFNKPGKWSSQIIDFVSRCLVKNQKKEPQPQSSFNMNLYGMPSHVSFYWMLSARRKK